MHPSPKLQISESAVTQLEKILSQHPGKFLRITIQPGGCNGFEYNLNLSDTICDDDITFEPNKTVKVIVDEMSLDLINGATLDYTAELIGSAFKLTNPNASTSCGCGNSFSV
jgi:iron-sulfur cluster insertion protein